MKPAPPVTFPRSVKSTIYHSVVMLGVICEPHSSISNKQSTLRTIDFN